MKTTYVSLRPSLLLCAGAALVAGCGGPITAGVRQTFVGAEYEQVYVTGSHIPVLVPKSPTARRVPGFSPLTILTPEEIRQRGILPMH